MRDVYRSIMSLQSPFESIQSFNVVFETNHKEWLEGLLTVDRIKMMHYSLQMFQLKGMRLQN